MISRVMLLAVALLSAVALGQTKPTTQTDGPWHKIKSADGHTKSRAVAVKFQPGTQRFRITLKSTADKDEKGRPNPSSSIRFGLMTETKRDVEDKPVNWRQVDDIYYGKPGETITETYDVPLGKNGEGAWFQVIITGYLAEYDIVVEDQSADDSAKAAKSKSKKKKEKDKGDDNREEK